MKIIQATFYIKETKRAAFLEDIRPLIESARMEKGCLAYHLYESVENQNQFIMIENWQDQGALEEHNQNPLLKNLFGKMPAYAAKKTEFVVVEKED